MRIFKILYKSCTKFKFYLKIKIKFEEIIRKLGKIFWAIFETFNQDVFKKFTIFVESLRRFLWKFNKKFEKIWKFLLLFKFFDNEERLNQYAERFSCFANFFNKFEDLMKN